MINPDTQPTIDDVSVALEEVLCVIRAAEQVIPAEHSRTLDPLLGAIERLTANARQMLNAIPQEV